MSIISSYPEPYDMFICVECVIAHTTTVNDTKDNSNNNNKRRKVTNAMEMKLLYQYPPPECLLSSATSLPFTATTLIPFCFPDSRKSYLKPGAQDSYCFTLTSSLGSRRFGHVHRIHPLPNTTFSAHRLHTAVPPLFRSNSLLSNCVSPPTTPRTDDSNSTSSSSSSCFGSTALPTSIFALCFLSPISTPPPPQDLILLTPLLLSPAQPYSDAAELISATTTDPIHTLLQITPPPMMLSLFVSILHERRLIFISNKIQFLSSSISALLRLLAFVSPERNHSTPLNWVHPLIPVTPTNLISCACAPFPFIIGIHNSLRSQLCAMIKAKTVEPDTLVVDLDISRVSSAVQFCSQRENSNKQPNLQNNEDKARSKSEKDCSEEEVEEEDQNPCDKEEEIDDMRVIPEDIRGEMLRTLSYCCARIHTNNHARNSNSAEVIKHIHNLVSVHSKESLVLTEEEEVEKQVIREVLDCFGSLLIALLAGAPCFRPKSFKTSNYCNGVPPLVCDPVILTAGEESDKLEQWINSDEKWKALRKLISGSQLFDVFLRRQKPTQDLVLKNTSDNLRLKITSPLSRRTPPTPPPASAKPHRVPARLDKSYQGHHPQTEQIFSPRENIDLNRDIDLPFLNPPNKTRLESGGKQPGSPSISILFEMQHNTDNGARLVEKKQRGIVENHTKLIEEKIKGGKVVTRSLGTVIQREAKGTRVTMLGKQWNGEENEEEEKKVESKEKGNGGWNIWGGAWSGITGVKGEKEY